MGIWTLPQLHFHVKEVVVLVVVMAVSSIVFVGEGNY